MPNRLITTAAICSVAAALLSPSDGFAPTMAGRVRSRGRGEGGAVSLRAASTCDSEIDRRSAIFRGAFGAAAASASTIIIPQAAHAAAAPAKAKARIPTWKLDKGVEFPTLALNTVGLTAEDTERALGLAVAEGFSHVDFHPGKERDGVGLSRLTSF